MPAKGQVNVVFQMILAIFPYLDIWAAYRVKKLRKFIVLMIIMASASVLFDSAFGEIIYPNGYNFSDEYWKWFIPFEAYFVQNDPDVILAFVIEDIIWICIIVYFMYRWSSQWNTEFSTTTPIG